MYLLILLLPKLFRNNKFSFLKLFENIIIIFSVSILIIIFSINDGFKNEFVNKFLNLVPQVQITLNNNQDKIIKIINKNPNIENFSFYSNTNALLRNSVGNNLTHIIGVDENYIQNFNIDKYLIKNKYNLNNNNIIIGQGIADKLKLKINDKIQVFFITNNGMHNIYLNVSNIIKSDTEIDNSIALISLSQLNNILKINNSQFIQLKLNNPMDLSIIKELNNRNITTQSWLDNYAHIYNDINLIMRIIMIIEIFVSILSAFILISSILLKIKIELNIIYTLQICGLSLNQVQILYFFYGFIKYIILLLISTIISILSLKYLLNHLINFIENYFSINFLNSKQYFIDYISYNINPIKIFEINIFLLFWVSIIIFSVIYYINKKQIGKLLSNIK